MANVFIEDLLDLPEQVSRGDFLWRLTEGVTRPDETLRNHVLTRQLAGCFDNALARAALSTGGRPKSTFL